MAEKHKTDLDRQSLAVLASWCADDVHFCTPTAKSRTQTTSFKTTTADCRPALAEKSEDLSPAPGVVAERDLPGANTEQSHEALRLRSVAILTDHFKVIAETKKQAAKMEKGPALSTRLFLLLCPPQPTLLERGQLSTRLNIVTSKFSTLMVTYGVVLLPVWLWLVRELHRREYAAAGASLLWTVLALVGLSQLMQRKPKGGFSSSRLLSARYVADQGRERLSPLTPPPPAPRAAPPLAIQPTSTPAPTPAPAPVPSAQPVSNGLASRISAAVPPLPPKSSIDDSLEATLPGQIQLVQEEVYGHLPPPPVWTQEVMLQQINKLCSEVGLPGLDSNADYKKMAARLHSVKNTLGLS